VLDDGAQVSVEGLLASLDGHVLMRHTVVSDHGPSAGAEVAKHLLREGGQSLLDH
jgi:hypothetical protein